MRSKELHLAQLGAGHWGLNLLRNFVQCDGVASVSVADPDPRRRELVQTRFPVAETTGDAEELMSRDDVDAVIVATPASLHFDHCRRALEAGKHVLVEKPLTMKSADAEELVDLADRTGRILMVGHTFLFNPAVRRIREYLEQGELGDLYYVTSQRLNLGRVRSDANALWTLAPHDVSIILYLLGESPSRVEARGLRCLKPSLEDVAFLHLDFPSGRAAHIHVSWLAPLKIRSMHFVGSRKMLVYDDVSTQAKISLFDRGFDRQGPLHELPDLESFSEYQLLQRTGDVVVPAIDTREPLQLECQHFVDCVREGRKPTTDGESGLEVVRILEAAQLSMEADR